jgi:replicative DNA helicase
MATNAEVVLGGALRDKARMGYVARRLRPEHFTPTLRPIYTLMLRYHQITGGVIGGAQFREQLIRAGVDPAMREAYERTFFTIAQAGAAVSEDKWRWQVQGMVEDRQAELLVDALTESMRVLTEGVPDRAGERLFGYADSRRVLAQKFAEMDRLGAEQTADGNVLEEAQDVLREYERAKTEGVHLGVETGLTTLDRLTFGAQRGEFWLIAAYAGEGKTQTLVNIAYNAVLAGKNVVFFTLETLRDQVRRRFFVRHANHPDFARFGAQISYQNLKGGALAPDEEEMFRAVVQDFTTRPGRGRMEVVWAPRGTAASYLAMRADVYEALWPVDLVVVDYAGLMGPGRRVERRQEGLVEILQALKGMATAHGGGKGVPLLSAYQTSRQARDEARISGGYSLQALAETAEAERSADLVLSLLRPEDEGRELMAQVLKYRDGGGGSFYLDADFDRSLVRDRDTSRAAAEDELGIL